MDVDSEYIPGLPSAARDALINTAIQKLVLITRELGVTVTELQMMFDLGMTPVDVLDYLDAKFKRRIQ